MRGVLWSCVAALALSACAVRYSAGVSGGATSPQASVSSGSPLGNAIIIGIMLSDGVHYYRVGPDGRTPVSAPPPLDPARKINVQDCTQPVDPEAGNLYCR